jgi:hypothetical protein
MTENPHQTRAASRLHNGTINEVQRAQAEATLALAYEQRTANLIALYGAEDLANKMDTPAWDNVAEQIKERLGL